MNTTSWVLVTMTGLLVAVVVTTGVLMWRRTRARQEPHGLSPAARRALRGLGSGQRSRRRGSLRGKGYGGDPGRAADLSSIDSGGEP